MPLPPHTITWREIVIREHRLAQLKRRIQLIRDDGTAPVFCANALWYGQTPAQPGLRDEISRLVGPTARPDDQLLGSEEAATVVHETLRALLPPCRGCTCNLLDGDYR